MQLPLGLQTAIEQIAETSKLSSLREAYDRLSDAYRRGDDSAASFRDQNQTLAYLLARMPATFAAVYKAMESLKEALPNWACRTLVDLGAGPGTASWAASEIFPELSTVTLYEKSHQVISIGQKLTPFSDSPALKNSQWVEQDLKVPFEVPKADLTVLSYVLAETDCLDLIKTVWDKGSTLLIVEPGTPKGFERILSIRKKLIEWGAFLAAPCPHQLQCPIAGWCHFPARVERTRIHKVLKSGSLGYEDEKYSYIAATPFTPLAFEGRVVANPLKLSGHVKLTLCTKEGKIEQKTISRKQKDLYRKARDAEWSSSWM